RSFQHRVLDWYAAHGRDLPWRRTRDPYAILVSEVLSHQTQIARVLPVYERLLGRYPTVTALASAPLAEVKAITDPLGYKVRGRWLHSAALRVADRPGGTFPDPLDSLRRLPAAPQLRLPAGDRQLAACALSWASVASASAREMTPSSRPSPVVTRLLVWMSCSRIDLSSSSSVTLGRKVLGPGRITC